MFARECITHAVFASPMLALLLATCFKFDVLAAQPRRCSVRRRLTPRVDRKGRPVYQDPDGRLNR
jgi:hypothetical protein